MTVFNGRYLLPTIYIYAAALALLSLSALSAFAHGDQTHTLTDSLLKQREVQQCLSLPTVDDSCYFSLCGEQSSYLCAEDILDAVVLLAGPEKAMPVLDSIMESPLFAIRTDGHQLAHRIGNSTLHHFGLSGESFLRCPTGFNYGCQHGFFEDALAQHSTPIKAAVEICESVPPYPHVNERHCYHGVGHGFMFHESYNLMHSLDLCDQLPSHEAQNPCWQGVFMENIHGFFSDVQGEMGFIDTDIFAPCNRIEKKYHAQCYENHAKYILYRHNNSVKDASHACLSAGDYIYNCMISIGSLSTMRGWQETLRGSFNGTFTENVVHICNQFPPEHIETCKLFGITNLLNFDGTDTQRSTDICLSFDNNRERCFETIGFRLARIAPDQDEITKGCNIAPKEYRDSCYKGVTDHQNNNETSSDHNIPDTQHNTSSTMLHSLLQRLQAVMYELFVLLLDNYTNTLLNTKQLTITDTTPAINALN